MTYASFDDLAKSISVLNEDRSQDEYFSDAALQSYLDRATHLINSHLQRYEMPISKENSPQSLVILKDIAIRLCGDMVAFKRNIFPEGESNGGDNWQNFSSRPLSDAMTLLKRLHDGELDLPDASLREGLVSASSAMVERFASNAPDAVKSLAESRIMAYLWDRPTMPKKDIFALSGAKGILGPWRTLRLSVVE